MYKYLLMSDEFIKKALEVAAGDYVRLMIERGRVARELAEIDREVAKLSMKVVSLATLTDDAPKDIAVSETLKAVSNIGLTDAVRSVLRASGDWMTPKEVRDRVLKLGLDLSKYQNPLASIHTILGRLDKEVEVSAIESASQRAARHRGKMAGKPKLIFRWKGPVETVWERLQKLPREKADEVVKEVAKNLAGDHIRKLMTGKSRGRKKGETY
jgi:hypothetical protein